MESQILKGLNQAQREAVVNYDSPSLIIAGAGSGKTRVLTSRIAYMIEQGVAPYNILALTFTNKAAEQMRERIAQMLPDGRHRYIRMGTFHSVFSRILRDNADRIGFPQSFTIYEPSDCKNLLKTIVRELNLDDTKYKPAMLASRISYAKNCLVTPGAYLANASFGAEDRRMQIPEFGNIYNIYCARCKRNGAMDFDDLLLQTNILLRDCPDVTARYQEQFKYILVDEYQDTNYAQYVIIRRLSQLHSKVCVVGDDAQSIYSFRGAKIENILSFKKDFPDAMIFKLEQNYRSTRTIVEAANSVIERNSKRMEKKCFSEGDMGEKIRVLRAYTDREEAEMVVSDLRDKVRAAGDEWAEAAILYRTNNQSQALEDALRRKGIPYRIYKGNSFYDHKEIKDLLAYIRLVINPRDDEAFKRIVNYPARGIGDTTVERIALLAKARNLSMWEAVDALTAEPVTDPVQKTIVRKVAEFVALVRGLSLARAEKGLYDLGLEIATRSGIIGAYRAENTPEATSALDNIEELLNSMQLFNEQREAEIRAGERQQEERATIEEWLQGVMLMTDMDKDDPQDRNKVTLMTVHSAKGLEYKFVYIVGLEENLFPSQRAVESPDGFEEERRLFYVALTRAKELATLSYAEMRFKWGNMEFSRPSCFLREIDPRYIESDADFAETRPQRRPGDDGPAAIDELRRRFDYRFQQKQQGGGRFGGGGNGGSGGYGSGYSNRSGYLNREYNAGEGRGFGSAYANRGQSQSGYGSGYGRSGAGTGYGSGYSSAYSDGTTQKKSEKQISFTGAPAAKTAAKGAKHYEPGDLVEHKVFGRGQVVAVKPAAGDQIVEINFEKVGIKKTMANFAPLTKITTEE